MYEVKIESSAAIGSTYTFTNTGEGQVRKIPEAKSNVEQEQASSQRFPGEKQLIDAIEKANKDFKTINTSLKFSIHEETKQILVKIIDNETKEVLREIPPEKILDMVASMLERVGLFVDKKV